MRNRQQKLNTATAHYRRSAAYWRARYEQLKSDFDELLAVNQILASRNAELEGRTVISLNPPRRNLVIDMSPKLIPRPPTSSSAV